MALSDYEKELLIATLDNWKEKKSSHEKLHEYINEFLKKHRRTMTKEKIAHIEDLIDEFLESEVEEYSTKSDNSTFEFSDPYEVQNDRARRRFKVKTYNYHDS